MKRLLVLALGAAFVFTAAQDSSAGLFDLFKKKSNGCCAPDPCCRPAKKGGFLSFLHHKKEDPCCVPAAPAPCCEPVSCCAPQPTCCTPAPSCCSPAGGSNVPSVAPKKPYEETPPPPKKGAPPVPKKGKTKPKA